MAAADASALCGAIANDSVTPTSTISKRMSALRRTDSNAIGQKIKSSCCGKSLSALGQCFSYSIATPFRSVFQLAPPQHVANCDEFGRACRKIKNSKTSLKKSRAGRLQERLYGTDGRHDRKILILWNTVDKYRRKGCRLETRSVQVDARIGRQRSGRNQT